MIARWVLIPVLMVTAVPATGQTAVPTERVEELYEDLSPLAISLREMATELRTPNDWRGVYRRGDEMVRVHGALEAVFSQSSYAVDKKRKTVFAQVPSGTVFYIGRPFELPTASPAPAPNPSVVRFENRVMPRVIGPIAEAPRVKLHVGTTPLPLTVPQVPVGSPGRMLEDTEYRAHRVRSLMQFAARMHVMHAEQR